MTHLSAPAARLGRHGNGVFPAPPATWEMRYNEQILELCTDSARFNESPATLLQHPAPLVLAKASPPPTGTAILAHDAGNLEEQILTMSSKLCPPALLGTLGAHDARNLGPSLGTVLLYQFPQHLILLHSSKIRVVSACAIHWPRPWCRLWAGQMGSTSTP